MNKYLLEKSELIPITNHRTTFCDCGFNVDFDSLDFEKKLQVINNIVRQSMIPNCRPNIDDTDTLIGNCHTAAKVSKEYLKELGLGEEIYYVFARKRSFDPSDKTTVHAILLIKNNDKLYQYDATPYVGYKYGCVEEIGENRWYEDYAIIDDEMIKYIDTMKELIYSSYYGTYDDTKTEFYLRALEEAERIDILHGYIVHAYESILNHLENKFEYDKIVAKIVKLDPYNSRNEKNKLYKDSLVIQQASLWREELESMDGKNPKRMLELAQNIVQELKFVYPEMEKRVNIGGTNYRLSTITPRVLMENGLNVVMIKPSAYFLGVEKKIREQMLLPNLGMCEYSVDLGQKTIDTGIEPMIFSHPLGLECVRAYTGRSDIMFTMMPASKLAKLKKEARGLGNYLYGQEVIWTDNKPILFDQFTTNLVHSTDSYAEGSLHYLMGYPEHQLMTRFMYPNLKLERIKKYE